MRLFKKELFRKKPKAPLEVAITLIHDAIEIAYTYKRDTRYMPSAEDLRLFKTLRETVWENHATARYIERTMEQRSRHEPEGARKFTDPAVADYHYPK